MKKYIVVFGLNYHTGPVGSPLNGCLNDAAYWQNYAHTKNFDSVTVMLDAQATKAAMVAALNSVLHMAMPDDLVVVAYSGHGTMVPLASQSLVPYDFSFDNPSTWLCYNELDSIYFPHELRGVKIVVIHDSCHSAANPILGFKDLNPHPTLNRFLDPPQNIKDRIIPDFVNKSALNSHKGALLLAGCQKTQTSADAYISGAYRGAFSYSLSTAIQANPSVNYFDAVLKARAWLASNGYDQVPAALGDDLFKLRAFFE